MLTVRDLTVDYGKISALRGVDLEVEEGTITFIVGPNGAGKSTILRTLAGLIKPAAGVVSFDGKDITNGAPEDLCRQGLVLVPEGRHIFGSLTVGENLSLGTTGRRDKADIRADMADVFELFPVLAERFDSNAGKLSGGEQQQLAIARALLQRPRLLMIDEPSLGLAPIVVDLVYERLKRLNTKGLTLLIVEQQTNRIMSIADRINILRNGQIVYSELTKDISSINALDDAYFGYEERTSQPDPARSDLQQP